MKNQLKISEKDKRLLFLLFSLIVIAGSYFFIYTKNISKAEEINIANESLRTRADELSQMQAQADTKKAEIEEFEKQITEIETQFPMSVSTADAIVIIDELEKYVGMKISSSQFDMYRIFYPVGVSTDGSGAGTTESPTDTTAVDPVSSDAETTDTAASDTTNVEPTVDGTVNDAQASQDTSQDAAQKSKFMGVKATVTITYQTTYAGLKKSIDYINQYRNKMNIEDVSVTYDTSTGNLMGNMKINMFSLIGADMLKEYEPPYIEDINTGRDNIFGTIQ